MGSIKIKRKTLYYIVGGLLLLWLLTGGVAIYRTRGFGGQLRYIDEETQTTITIGLSKKGSSFDIPFLVLMRSYGKPFSFNVNVHSPENAPFVELQLDHVKVSYPDGTWDHFIQHDSLSLHIHGKRSYFMPSHRPQGKGQYWLNYNFPKHLKLDYGKHAYADIEVEGALIKKNGDRTELKLKGRSQRMPPEFYIVPFYYYLMRL